MKLNFKKGDLIMYEGRMLYFEKKNKKGDLVFSEPKAFSNYKLRTLTQKQILLYGQQF